MCCVPSFIMHLTCLSCFGYCVGSTLATHFDKCSPKHGLKVRFLKNIDAESNGGPWKVAPKSPLGGDSRFIQRRQFEYFDIDRVLNLAQHHTSILGTYVQRNCPSFFLLDRSENNDAATHLVRRVFSDQPQVFLLQDHFDCWKSQALSS